MPRSGVEFMYEPYTVTPTGLDWQLPEEPGLCLGIGRSNMSLSWNGFMHALPSISLLLLLFFSFTILVKIFILFVVLVVTLTSVLPFYFQLLVWLPLFFINNLLRIRLNNLFAQCAQFENCCSDWKTRKIKHTKTDFTVQSLLKIEPYC